MNNLQFIIKDNSRYAMHVAVELCEQGDFDSVTEAFKWLMQERDDSELVRGTCEPKWTLQDKTQTQEFWRCECGNCGECFGVEDRSSFPLKMTIDKVEIPNYCSNCGWKVGSE